MVQLQNISVTFNETKVLENLSCTIADGECIVVVGANGSGKSTLFNVITGAIQPNAGAVKIDGQICTQLPAQKRAAWISCLLQDTTANTVASMTVAQNLAMALYKGKRASLKNGMTALHSNPEVLTLIRKLGLEHLLERPMGSISGGQRQLIAFIMATIVPPKILLLDEPTAALDPQAAATLLNFAQEFIKQHKITTLLITHDQQIAATFGSQVWTIEKGTFTQRPQTTSSFAKQQKQE